MTVMSKAIWTIETRLTQELSLDDVAAVCGVSRYHLSRVFAASAHMPLTRYVRGRRLTRAAQALVGGSGDILSLALDSGYGSHEAFTRAFREQFGRTPEALRARGSLDGIRLMEPLTMDELLLTDLDAPRYVDLGTFSVAGLCVRYNSANVAGIPSQWERFAPSIGHIPGQVGHAAYGVICNGDDEGNYDYIAGVEVADFGALSAEWTSVRVPAQRYAVFVHRDHVSTIRRTWYTIWNRWLPESGHVLAEAPEFERYGEDFDPRTGTGPVEIWISLAR